MALREIGYVLLHTDLEEFSETLEGRDVTIWERRIVAEDPETLQEHGEHFGVSRERATQLEARIKKRLTKFLGARYEELQSA